MALITDIQEALSDELRDPDKVLKEQENDLSIPAQTPPFGYSANGNQYEYEPKGNLLYYDDTSPSTLKELEQMKRRLEEIHREAALAAERDCEHVARMQRQRMEEKQAENEKARVNYIRGSFEIGPDGEIVEMKKMPRCQNM